MQKRVLFFVGVNQRPSSPKKKPTKKRFPKALFSTILAIGGAQSTERKSRKRSRALASQRCILLATSSWSDRGKTNKGMRIFAGVVGFREGVSPPSGLLSICENCHSHRQFFTSFPSCFFEKFVHLGPANRQKRPKRFAHCADCFSQACAFAHFALVRLVVRFLLRDRAHAISAYAFA